MFTGLSVHCAAAPPGLRPVLAADAIARSRVALGDLDETFLAQGRALSDDGRERHLEGRLRHHLGL